MVKGSTVNVLTHLARLLLGLCWAPMGLWPVLGHKWFVLVGPVSSSKRTCWCHVGLMWGLRWVYVYLGPLLNQEQRVHLGFCAKPK